MSISNRNILPYFMWILGSLFFCYQFILRLWPSLLMSDIMQQFKIDATAFGFMSSMYYYGYATMQIPLAIMLDRFGVKKILFYSVILCAFATYLFTSTDNWALALLARFLVGAGSAVGFLGASKVISQWFSKEKYARMVGFTFSFGLLGAIYGGKPITNMIGNFGWQQVAYFLVIAAILIALLILFFLKERQENIETSTMLKLSDFKQALKMPALWWLAIANLLMVGSLEGFADVWGVNYLMKAYDFDKPKAAEITSLIFIGMLFGGPLLAYISENIGTKVTIILCAFGMALLLCIVIFIPKDLSFLALKIIFFLIGVMCCYQVLVFAAGSKLVSPALLGVAIAFLNCINMLGGSFFHTIIGRLMDVFWGGELQGNIKIYSVLSYQKSLLIIPFCALIGGIIIYCLRKKQ